MRFALACAFLTLTGCKVAPIDFGLMQTRGIAYFPPPVLFRP
jgi:hypothetical protein